jgi:hypothetical protein
MDNQKISAVELKLDNVQFEQRTLQQWIDMHGDQGKEEVEKAGIWRGHESENVVVIWAEGQSVPDIINYDNVNDFASQIPGWFSFMGGDLETEVVFNNGKEIARVYCSRGEWEVTQTT